MDAVQIKERMLKQKTPLKSYTPLKAHTSLARRTPLKAKTELKCKQKSARKLKEPYRSIFTDDLSVCYITGDKESDTTHIHPHHIFGGPRKRLSETYGFILPLRSDWHEGTTYSIHEDRALDLKYKAMCEKYYINTLHKTKEDWISEFGQWWETEIAA